MSETSEYSRSRLQLSPFVGWCVIGAAISQIPVLVGGLVLLKHIPSAGRVLLLFSVPTMLILTIGGIGLILRRSFGYYSIYLATFFGGLGYGGLKISYIPFLQGRIKLGPMTEDLFLALNLVIVAVLVWDHFNFLKEMESSRKRIHRTLIIGFLILGAGSISFGRAMVRHDKGRVASAAALPYIGAKFVTLEKSGPAEFVSVYYKPQRSLTLVFAGVCTEASIQSVAEIHNLKQMTDPNAHQKFLPQVKSWNLDQNTFPTHFDSSDLSYVGRLKDVPRVTCQIVYRKSDGRFTAQIIGFLP